MRWEMPKHKETRIVWKLPLFDSEIVEGKRIWAERYWREERFSSAGMWKQTSNCWLWENKPKPEKKKKRPTSKNWMDET